LLEPSQANSVLVFVVVHAMESIKERQSNDAAKIALLANQLTHRNILSSDRLTTSIDYNQTRFVSRNANREGM
jgi:hypothetical protein